MQCHNSLPLNLNCIILDRKTDNDGRLMTQYLPRYFTKKGLCMIMQQLFSFLPPFPHENRYVLKQHCTVNCYYLAQKHVFMHNTSYFLSCKLPYWSLYFFTKADKLSTSFNQRGLWPTRECVRYIWIVPLNSIVSMENIHYRD